MSLTYVYKSPIGPLKVVANEDGICAVKFLFGKQQDSTSKPMTVGKGKNLQLDDPTEEEVSIAALEEDSSEKKQALEHLRVCIDWLDAYFGGSVLQSSPPRPQLVFRVEEGTFFHSVWSTLASTGVGERLSYSELAKLAGSPKAARAVGQAMKRHSLPILVPCHRVVKSKGGGIGNYSGGEGSATKEWLLEHEREMALCNNTVQ